jgi:pimeloyl-ACP methyl ester carboxylesterase
MKTLSLLLSAGFAIVTLAQAQPPAFDARLSSYPYPFPIHILPIDTQRQNLELVYMDVQPEAPASNTVLLLHGKNFSGAYWASTIAALNATGYRVVVPDQIGFGKSSKPRDFQYTFQTLALHTKELLDALGVGTVSIVGHSMGGMLATRFALMFPDRVDKLILVNPIGLEDWKLKVPYVPVDALFMQERAKKPGNAKSYMQENYFHGEWRPEYEALVEIPDGWLRGADHEALAWTSALTYDMIFTQPVLYEFPKLTTPTLLIIGQRDRTALGKNTVAPDVAETMGQYPELGRKTAKAIPGAVLVELENTGHLPQYEDFDRYIGVVQSFLGR